MSDKSIVVFTHGEIEITQDEKDTLVRSISTQKPTDAEINLFFYDCARRGVHPLDKLIYFTKRKGRYTPIVGIDYMRMRAESSGAYAGSDDAVFTGAGEYPQAATIAVYKMVDGQRCSFSATARWKEYAPFDIKDDGAFMWRKMPYTMLAKCAEALALRKGFPGQLHGLYTSEEFAQAGPIDGDVVDSVVVKQPASKPELQVTVEPRSLTNSEDEGLVKEQHIPSYLQDEVVESKQNVTIPLRSLSDASVKEVTWNANKAVPQKFEEWFVKQFVGPKNVFGHENHLRAHLKKYYNVNSMAGVLLCKDAKTLVEYAYLKSEDELGRLDPIVYKDKVGEISIDTSEPDEQIVIGAEEATTDSVAIIEYWGEVIGVEVEMTRVILEAFGEIRGLSVLTDEQKRSVWEVISAVQSGLVNMSQEDIVEMLKLNA